MRTVEIEAESELAALVAEAEAGQEIMIARAGKPVARLVPVDAVRPKLKLGLLDGTMTIPDDFDDMFSEEIRIMFEGE